MTEDNWKEKYLSLIEQENQQPEVIEILRRGLVEVSLTSRGLDAQLDQLLANLRKYLRESQRTSIDTEKFNLFIDQIAVRQEELEPSKEAFASTSAESLTEIIHHLGDLGLNKVSGKNIISALYAENYPMIELPDILNELSKLAAQIESSESENSALSALNAIRSKTELLINSLSVPPSMESRLATIKHELETIDAVENIYAFVELFSQFIIELLNSEHQKLKDYLENLEAPLKIIENLIHNNESQNNERKTNQIKFKKGLTAGLTDIQNSIDSETDLDVMKVQIQTRMEQITEEFIHYEKERSLQEESQLKAYELLKSEFLSLKQAQKAALSEIERFQQKSLTDPLTQIPNRAAWEQHIDTEWQRFQRYDTRLSLAIVDIDHFKHINDNFGHSAGDNVLRAVAQQLRKYLRSTDILARFGGEEFALLLPETDIENATIALNHVREKINKAKFKYQGKQVPVTVSIGVAEADKSITAEHLFNLADDAMYLAKKSGRNRVCTNLELAKK